jgi:hypothetical protein
MLECGFMLISVRWLAMILSQFDATIMSTFALAHKGIVFHNDCETNIKICAIRCPHVIYRTPKRPSRYYPEG